MCEVNVPMSNAISRIKDLDALLRCGICYEYMKTSMITTCSHNYCSLCIRQSLTYKAQCPACFKEAFDYQLRNNRILDDIIKVFIELSDEVETFLQNYRKLSEPRSKVNTVPGCLQNSISDFRERNDVHKGNVNIVSSNQRDKKAAFGELSESTSSLVTSSYVPKSENITAEVDPSDDCDNIRLQNVASIKQPHQSPSNKRMVSKGEMLIPSKFSPLKNSNASQGLVSCPVCNTGIPERNINVHLDACLERSQHSVQDRSPTKVQKRKPLPKLVYHVLQEKELRKMLKEKGLSTHGDRKALISRHQRFTLLYNSESDTLNPRPTADLVKQIEKEEQEEKKVCSVATVTNKLKIDRKMDPKVIEQAQQQYRQQNKASFESLIHMIKKREAEKKTAVKQNLVVNGEEDDCVEIPVDSIKEACAEEVVGQKTAMESCVSVSDENYAVENRYDLCEPSVSMAPTSDTRMVNNVGDNVNCNENISEALCDMNYGSDTDEAVSPVLCRNTVGNCSRVESDKYSKREPTQNLTPDMLEKSSSRSGTQKCSSPVKQSKEVEAGDNSDLCNNQNTSLLAEHTQETAFKSDQQSIAYEVDERLASRRAHKQLNLQLDDADFEPNSEEFLSDFEVREAPVRRRRRRRCTRKSSEPSSSIGERIPRKRVKH